MLGESWEGKVVQIWIEWPTELSEGLPINALSSPLQQRCQLRSPTMTRLWPVTVFGRIQWVTESQDRTRHKSQQYSRVVGAVDTVYWWPTMTVLCWSSVRHESLIRQTPSTAHHNSQLNIQSIVWDCSGVELMRGDSCLGPQLGLFGQSWSGRANVFNHSHLTSTYCKF